VLLVTDVRTVIVTAVLTGILFDGLWSGLGGARRLLGERSH